MNRVDIYDLEDFPNFFSYTGIDRDTKKVNQFYIFDNKDHIGSLFDYLATLKGMIGFNNLAYDGQLINYLLENEEEFRLLSPEELTKRLYKFSQRLITISRENGEKLPYFTFFIPQLDLFKIWHFDNHAKSTSLKKLEFAMNFENVEDLPFKYDHIVKKNEIGQIMA